MRVVIVGAGEVGSAIATTLADSHDVVVIDVDPDRVDTLTYGEDVLAIEGDGTDLSTLAEAGVEGADMVIASTDSDETNLAICGTVDTVSDAFTIARVQRIAYLETWDNAEGAFGVDFMVSTNLLTAHAIVQVIGIPTALDLDPFSGGLVEMAEFEIVADSPFADTTIAEADRFEGLTFAALIRDGSAILPSGEDALHWGDKVVVIGLPESVREFGRAVTPEATPEEARDVVIIGGSRTGELVASLLEDRGFTPRLIEQDPERAREIAEENPGTTVLEYDATDSEFLEREHVREADVAVSTLDSDARTLLAALLAKEVGVSRALAVVDEAQYVELFEAVGVDVAVNPRQVTAEEITRFTRKRRAENVAIVEPGTAEVLEFEVDADSVLANRQIREAVADLPEGVVIGAITRGDDFVTPRGETEIVPGDHVVLFVREEAVEQVAGSV
ncbi:MAG: Trk system potassium transporter TrkA [Halodesulfurarchaeum sp.]